MLPPAGVLQLLLLQLLLLAHATGATTTVMADVASGDFDAAETSAEATQLLATPAATSTTTTTATAVPFCPAVCTCKPAIGPDSGGLKLRCGGGSGTAHKTLSTLKDIDFGSLQRAEVQQLDVSRNQIADLEAADFANLTALRKLDLSGNVLTSIEAHVFGELVGLEKLRLAGNAIVHVSQGAFDGMAQLKQM